jgi:hypothetical protein
VGFEWVSDGEDEFGIDEGMMLNWAVGDPRPTAEGGVWNPMKERRWRWRDLKWYPRRGVGSGGDGAWNPKQDPRPAVESLRTKYLQSQKAKNKTNK